MLVLKMNAILFIVDLKNTYGFKYFFIVLSLKKIL